MGIKKRSKLKTVLLSILIPIALILVLLIGYFLYLILSYHRVGDQPELEIVNEKTAKPEAGTEYKLLSYNIGFCAYTRNQRETQRSDNDDFRDNGNNDL